MSDIEWQCMDYAEFVAQRAKLDQMIKFIEGEIISSNHPKLKRGIKTDHGIVKMTSGETIRLAIEPKKKDK